MSPMYRSLQGKQGKVSKFVSASIALDESKARIASVISIGCV